MFKNLLLIGALALSINASEINLEEINNEVKIQCTDLGIEALNHTSELEKQKEYVIANINNYLTRFSYLNNEKLVNHHIHGECIEVAFEYLKQNK